MPGSAPRPTAPAARACFRSSSPSPPGEPSSCTFTSAEAELAGQKAGVSRRTVFSTLKRLCETNPPVLLKVKQGLYEKVVKHCTTAPCTSALSNGVDANDEQKVQSAEVQSASDAQKEGGNNE